MDTSFSLLKRVALTLSILDPLLPLWMKKIFYYVPYLLLQKLLIVKKLNGQLWLRNSVFFNEMVFPLSDIDLTYYNKNGLSCSDLKLLKATVKLVKRFLPHVGELACYDEQGLKSFGHFVNFYELKRDPTLMKKMKELNIAKDYRKRGDDIAFVLRWLESDIHQLHSNFRERTQKIERFLMVLQQSETSANTLDELIEDLFEKRSDLYSCPLSNNQVLFVKKYFFKMNSENYDNPNEKELDMLFTFFPHRWIGLPLDVREKTRALTFMNDDQRNICSSQLYWETWGLFTQLSDSQNMSGFLAHLESLKEVAGFLKEDRLLRGLVELEALYLELGSEELLS